MLYFNLGALVTTVVALFLSSSSSVGADGTIRTPYSPAFSQQTDQQTWLSIRPGQAEIIRYNKEPGTVIVGNSEIAVASFARSDTLILTGLQAGVTNVIVLDDDGEQIDRINLRVALSGQNVTVSRALDRQVLLCDPLCSPLGEAGIVSDPVAPIPAAPNAVSNEGVAGSS